MLDPSDPDDRHTQDRLARPPIPTRSRRPIFFAVAVAALATIGVVAVVQLGIGRPAPSDSGELARGRPAPDISGTTLDGAAFHLADLRGHPVILNFWGPSCVPCRSEFPLFKMKLTEHAADGLVLVGVLMVDPPDPARAFVRELGATWATVVDPTGTFRSAYRAVARPQSYFIDRDGVLRAIQIGEVVAVDFERQYATIKP
jgi:cytochrome c biogenesis protein CcmG/thiol:disulfide interchange protein DsbE